MMASGIWERGEPGGLYWLRTGWPVAFAMAAGSKKPRAAGVAMTWTVQPRWWASRTKVPMAVAGPAPHTMTDRTRAGVRRAAAAWCGGFPAVPAAPAFCCVCQLGRRYRVRGHAPPGAPLKGAHNVLTTAYAAYAASCSWSLCLVAGRSQAAGRSLVAWSARDLALVDMAWLARR